jgi:hypothetical protein
VAGGRRGPGRHPAHCGVCGAHRIATGAGNLYAARRVEHAPPPGRSEASRGACRRAFVRHLRPRLPARYGARARAGVSRQPRKIPRNVTRDGTGTSRDRAPTRRRRNPHSQSRSEPRSVLGGLRTALRLDDCGKDQLQRRVPPPRGAAPPQRRVRPDARSPFARNSRRSSAAA